MQFRTRKKSAQLRLPDARIMFVDRTGIPSECAVLHKSKAQAFIQLSCSHIRSKGIKDDSGHAR